jgi:hypothetical protein
MNRARLKVELLEARCTPTTLITTVPYVITNPGTYQLAADLYYGATSGSAISVQSGGVVIDFNGYKLSSATGAATTAVGIVASDKSFITIENGTIQGFQFGIQVAGENSYGNQVQKMALDNNWYVGLWVEGTGTVVANNSIVNTGGCDIPGYTIPIGIHVAGPDSIVAGNRVTGLVRYPGVTQEVIALALDDAPHAVVAYNIFKASYYTDNSWGLWINSVDDDGTTSVDLKNNTFANFQYGSSFDNSQGQIANNRYVNVAIQWSGSPGSVVTDLGGNIGRQIIGSNPLSDKWIVGTSDGSPDRHFNVPLSDDLLNSLLAAGRGEADNLDTASSDAPSLAFNATPVNVLAPSAPGADSRPVATAQGSIGNVSAISSAPLQIVTLIANYIDRSYSANDPDADNKATRGTDLFQTNSLSHILSDEALASSWLETVRGVARAALPFAGADRPEQTPQVLDGGFEADDGGADWLGGADGVEE